ncbi:putative sodium-dependent multivitamin transporter [Centruroides vittatus]|uniref:putative sodium-dependent multivitamin transporter n=1 Tax=Centruroides vittatus TaxID=120091 RepID=UPI00350F80EB
MERVIFGVVDYIVFSLMLFLSAMIGVYFRFTGGKQRTTNEFFLGSRDMGVIPVAFSMMTSYFSATGMLGISSETYLYGFHLTINCIVCFIATPIVIYIYHIVFYELKLITVNEYINRRFGKFARWTTTIIFMLQTLLYCAVVLYAPALTLSIVTGISLWASVLSVGIVCTFYCTLGGIKAVVWTDVFQVILMYTTVMAILVKGCMDVGGFGEMWRISEKGGRITVPNFDFDVTNRYGFWSLMFGGFFFHLAVNSINQTQVQRMMTLGNLKKSRLSIYAMQPVLVLFIIGLSLCGLVIYANMGQCDPILRPKETGITASDQLLPYYVMQSLGKFPGLPGLCVSGIFSASISTISSGVNSLSAVTLEDFIKPYCCSGRLTESKASYIMKVLVIVYGLSCILLSYLVEQLDVLMQVSITVLSVLGGPIFGVFTLGMLFVRPNEKGAVTGIVISSVLFLWIGIGNNLAQYKTTKLPQTIMECDNLTQAINMTISRNFTHVDERDIFSLYKISFWWFSVFSTLLTVIIGYFVSLITGPNKTVEKELLTPAARWLYGYNQSKLEKELEMEAFQDSTHHM